MEEADLSQVTTLFVKNLNFGTTEESLRELFSKYGKVRAVSIGKKKDSKNSSSVLSMGYGFVEFHSKEDALKAIKNLQVLSQSLPIIFNQIEIHFMLMTD
jgi:multiple RNA-binding domain-containing protein 1